MNYAPASPPPPYDDERLSLVSSIYGHCLRTLLGARAALDNGRIVIVIEARGLSSSSSYLPLLPLFLLFPFPYSSSVTGARDISDSHSARTYPRRTYAPRVSRCERTYLSLSLSLSYRDFIHLLALLFLLRFFSRCENFVRVSRKVDQIFRSYARVSQRSSS